MAVVITGRAVNNEGDRKVIYADIRLDTSYPTGGSTLTPATLGMTRITYADTPTTPAGLSVVFDRANNKLLTFTGGVQTTNATDQSAITVRCQFKGK